MEWAARASAEPSCWHGGEKGRKPVLRRPKNRFEDVAAGARCAVEEWVIAATFGGTKCEFSQSPSPVIGLTSSAALAEPAGMTALAFSADHQDRAVEGVVWYPAGNGGQLTVYADNPVWVGIVVSQDAAVADGAHPVILLSHGLGGNVRSLTWLATGLAKLGAIVVAVNHPGSTTGDLDLMRSMQHWTRVQDLQAALDAVLADPRFAGHVDADRVYAAGFSLGGWTALSIGGVLGDSMAQAEHCRLAGPKSTHCMDLARAGIDLTKQDVAKWGRSYRDPRIKAVAAIDPAFTHGTTADSVKDVVGNLTLIGLGVGNDRLLAADFSDAGSGFRPAGSGGARGDNRPGIPLFGADAAANPRALKSSPPTTMIRSAAIHRGPTGRRSISRSSIRSPGIPAEVVLRRQLATGCPAAAGCQTIV